MSKCLHSLRQYIIRFTGCISVINQLVRVTVPVLRVNMADNIISLCDSHQPQDYNCSHLNITEVSLSLIQGQGSSRGKLGGHHFNKASFQILQRKQISFGKRLIYLLKEIIIKFSKVLWKPNA